MKYKIGDFINYAGDIVRLDNIDDNWYRLTVIKNHSLENNAHFSISKKYFIGWPLVTDEERLEIL